MMWWKLLMSVIVFLICGYFIFFAYQLRSIRKQAYWIVKKRFFLLVFFMTGVSFVLGGVLLLSISLKPETLGVIFPFLTNTREIVPENKAS